MAFVDLKTAAVTAAAATGINLADLDTITMYSNLEGLIKLNAYLTGFLIGFLDNKILCSLGRLEFIDPCAALCGIVIKGIGFIAAKKLEACSALRVGKVDTKSIC